MHLERKPASTCVRAFATVLFGVTVIAGCSDDDTVAASPDSGRPCAIDTSYKPTIDPAKFVDVVDNPLFPLIPGTKLTYAAGDETIELEVLHEKKMVMGIACTIVHDVAKLSGEVIEDTFDWFAQDDTGAVWYMGEETRELSGGVVTSTHGSWEAGKDVAGIGHIAQPGYIIPPNPSVGLKFRQEYYACEAEDWGEVLALDATATVPTGSYSGCMKTRDTTPLEPAALEEKYYCPNVGVVLIVDVKSQDREELTTVVRP